MTRLFLCLLFIAVADMSILPDPASAQAGFADPSFGDNGVVTVLNDGSVTIGDMIILPEHRILLAASNELWCFTGDGNWDPSFGNEGKFALDSSVAKWISDITLTSDGKILLTGTFQAEESDDLLLLKLNADGSPDTSFGENGRVLYGYQHDTFEYGANSAELDDGSILVTANTGNMDLYIDNFYPVLFLKLQADGTPDNSFGESDVLYHDAGGSRAEVNDMEVQPDGKILVAGFAYASGKGSGDDYWVMRLNADRSADTSFGAGGSVIMDMMLPTDSARNSETSDVVFDIDLQSDGKIVVLGRKFYTSDEQLIPGYNNLALDINEMVMIRLNSNGSQDMSFGQNGRVEGFRNFENNYNSYYSLQIDSLDRIYAAHTPESILNQSDYSITRFLANGTPDLAFGYYGIITFASQGAQAFKKIRLDEGRLIAAGTMNISTSPAAQSGMSIYKLFTTGDPLAINAVAEPEIPVAVYPNPVEDLLNISFRATPEKIHITLINAGGIQVAEEDYLHKRQIGLPVDWMPPGIYFLQVEYDWHAYFSKIIKR